MKFTKDHEYVDVSGAEGTVGISEYAQAQLGDIVYVEVPQVAAKFNKGDAAAVVESVKAASDVFSPVSGEVVAVNEKLAGSPSLVNEDAQGQGWLFKLMLTNSDELDGLMDAAAYAEYLKTLG
jgi:glycine cleavage system H protein